MTCPHERHLCDANMPADPDDEIAEADEGNNCGSVLVIG